MGKIAHRSVFLSIALFLSFSAVSLSASPLGSDSVENLYSPAFAGGGAFVTSTGSSQANSVNPAASGAEQRTIVDAGYLALMGLGDESGLGHLLGLGIVYPTKYAVFGASSRFLNSPFDAFPLGTTLSLDLNAAKELYPGLSLGAGLVTGFGSDWTLGLDLGVRQELGKIGMLNDFTWALTLGGLGKSHAPAAFTPTAGLAFDFLRIEGKDGKKDPLRLGLAADLGLPGFTDLSGKFGLSATIAGIAKISTSSGFSLKEALDGTAVSPIPSIGLTLNFTLAGKGNGKLPSDGELATSLAARPLYEGIWGIGGGAAWTLGVADKTAPAIRVDYPEKRWISPNNDGKVDALEFSIGISDQRYVSEWVFDVKDEKGNLVRTLRNKERRPETAGVRLFMDRLTDVKSGVEVPPSLRWDGSTEAGSIAADGNYFFTLSAKDDNGNAAVSPRYEVALDNTAPEITVEVPSDPLRILSPDGDGNKDTFSINQTGSVEELWTAGIFDGAGTKVRNLDIRNAAPAPFIWDGKDDTGKVVPDGVYKYQIESTDRALNSGSGSLDNIIVNTEKPRVSLLIDEAYFSPNGDEVKDTLLLKPDIPVKDGIVSWTIKIEDQSGTLKRTISGTKTAPQRQDFDGKDDAGRVLSEGSYRALLSVVYQNGNNAVASSPSFSIDLTAPSAASRADFAAFSPNGDGKQDEMIIRQEGSDEAAWRGEIRRAEAVDGKGVLYKTFHFSGIPSASISWDGKDENGRLAGDGDYEYRLISTDKAGNTGSSKSARFSLSTADTPVLITADHRFFSPNGDGVKDSLTLSPQVQVLEGISSWKVDILNAGATAIRSFEGKNVLPKTLVWDGRDSRDTLVNDGSYSARIELRYAMGNQPVANSAAFVVDTQAPEAEVSTEYTLFSPNEDARRDMLPILVKTKANDTWDASITDMKGLVLASWNWRGAAPSIIWNGKDMAGNAAIDGNYTFTLRSVDDAGNRFERKIEGIVLDARPARAFLTVSATGFSPNGDSIADDIRFGIITTLKEGIASWRLEIIDEAGSVHKTFTAEEGTKNPIPPESLVWDGRNDNASITEGKRTARLNIFYTKGDIATATAGPFILDVSAPVLKFSASPRYFSPDNDGVEDELTMRVSAEDASPISSWQLEIREPRPPFQVFYRLEGKGEPAERIVWDGRSNKGELVQAATDYKLSLSVTDKLGNSAKLDDVIGVDVLIIREGDVLKIKVPSIIFRENGNDFNGLPQDTVDNNLRVLKRIAEILNKFRDYKVKVEGHANPVIRTAAEEKNELQPLSEARAKAVLDKLVEYGVDSGRLSSIGMGGTRPVVKWEAYDDWWKNRRVEFILIK